VAEVNPNLIVRDKNGKPYSVRYDHVNAMLLNEFLKEHKRVEKQQATIEQLKSHAEGQEVTIDELKKDIEVLTAKLKAHVARTQRIEAYIEATQPVTRRVVENR